MDCSLAGCSVHGVLQARIPERVAMPSSGDLPNPGTEPTFLTSPAFADVFFTTSTTWEALLRNYFSSMWLGRILCKTSIRLNLFRLVLRPSIWSILENLPHVIENNLHPAVIWSVQ